MRNRHPKPLKLSDGAMARLEQEAERRGVTIYDVLEELVTKNLPPVTYKLSIQNGVLGNTSTIKK